MCWHVDAQKQCCIQPGVLSNETHNHSHVLLSKKMETNYFYKNAPVDQTKLKKKKKKPSIIPFESCFQNEKCYYILQVELQVTSRNTAKQYWKLFQLMFKAEGKRKLSNLSWGTNLLCGLKQCLILLVPLSAQLESITIYLETKTRSSVRFRCSLKVAFSLNTFQTIAK